MEGMLLLFQPRPDNTRGSFFSRALGPRHDPIEAYYPESGASQLKYLCSELSSAHAFCRSVRYFSDTHSDRQQRVSRLNDSRTTCRTKSELRCKTCLQLSQMGWSRRNTSTAPLRMLRHMGSRAAHLHHSSLLIMTPTHLTLLRKMKCTLMWREVSAALDCCLSSVR